MNRRYRWPLAAILGAWGLLLAGKEAGIFPVLSSVAALGRQDGGFYLLPTNQFLRPWGEQTPIRGRPVDLAFDPARHTLAVLNSESVLLLDGSSGARLAEVPSDSTSYGGIAFTPDGRELWASEATRNGPDHILVIRLSANGLPEGWTRMKLEGHPVPIGIAFTRDGASAYIAFSRSNTLAEFDVKAKKLRREHAAGIAPFSVVVAEKQRKIFVSNRGGRRPAPGDTLAPTSGAHVASDPITGSTVSGTVSVLDMRTQASQEVSTGLAPSGMALSPDERLLAVASSHSDSVTLLDTKTLRRADVKIPAVPDGVIGSLPASVAFSADGGRLYAGCGGNNSIAVLEGKPWRLAGQLPSGWFPSAIAVASDGSLRVINIKGTGNTDDGRGSHLAVAYEGSLVRIPRPGPGQLSAGAREVVAANLPRLAPAGGVGNLASLGIRHTFLIIKENRTYDQVFGDMPRGNGDPRLVMYGREITPNHHALAERYVLLDNCYTTSAISFDGHQWLMQAFVSDYVERAFAASPRGYAWDMSDALTVSPAGFFWQGAPHPVSVRVFGEFCLPARWDPAKQNAVDITERELLPWSEYWRLYKEGRWRDAAACSASGVPALKPILSPRFPFNETVIPDQIRAEAFLEELAEFEKTGEMPNINIITLTADHTEGTRPGVPTPRAMVADNDLALGRIVEGISKSRFWPHSLILVIEDDAQDGLDHVDGHRTVALAIGPYVHRGAVDSNNYNQLSMVRTIQEIFRIPARTRFLSTARAMTSVFTPQADLAVYHSIPSNIRLDEMNPPLSALQGRRLWAARQCMAMNFADLDDVPSDVLNRILWWDRKGYDTPYPGRHGR